MRSPILNNKRSDKTIGNTEDNVVGLYNKSVTERKVWAQEMYTTKAVIPDMDRWEIQNFYCQ